MRKNVYFDPTQLNNICKEQITYLLIFFNRLFIIIVRPNLLISVYVGYAYVIHSQSNHNGISNKEKHCSNLLMKIILIEGF